MNSEGRQPDIYFTPTPERVANEMLRIARVTADDLVFDLGCGDGRILLTAADRCGARGFGVDIDRELLSIARLRTANAGLNAQIRFEHQDFFATDLSPASVITLYLLDSINVRLRPKILAQCRPGTRIVSYSFEMGEWEADDYTPIAANGVHLWVVPANLSGTWQTTETSAPHGLSELRLRQTFQKIRGEALIDGHLVPIEPGRVHSDSFELSIQGSLPSAALRLTGRIRNDGLHASIHGSDGEVPWSAQRQPGTSQSIAV